MLVNEFPPLAVGGAERQAERLSIDLVKRGWRVWVLTRHAPGLPASELRFGFNIIRPNSWGQGKLRTVSFVIGALLELWRLRKKYDLLHAHLAFGPAFAAVLAARILGKRVVVKLGNSGEFGDIQVSQKTWRGKLRLAVLRRWSDIVIVLDEAMQAEALSAGFSTSQIRRMVNGIETNAYAPSGDRVDAQKKLGFSDQILVLSMGRLTAQKSLPFLLQVFASAHAENSKLHLMIVGDGPERGSLEALAESLDINQFVSFVGNQIDVRLYLAAADIFVLPSASEGISNALLEAMSAGLTCLATPVGGNSEVLGHGICGLILPLGDLSTWSRALVEISLSPELRIQFGKAALERVRREYDFSVVGERMIGLYAELPGFDNPGFESQMGVKR
ncbi:MAG: glycosyltransferase family 4 protein [Chloroflexota bacterium]